MENDDKTSENCDGSEEKYNEVTNEGDADSNCSDDHEPLFKYVRISNSLISILEQDAASCVAVHPKFICLGTVWGSIYQLDFEGNSIGNPENSARNVPLLSHSVAVNQISIDIQGNHIASCSDDGKVYVYDLYSKQIHWNLSTGRLIRSVAIDPYYKKTSARRIVTGDERLVLHEKMVLSIVKEVVLADVSMEGGVKNMSWGPGADLLAWATLLGFRVYDLQQRTSLGLIEWARRTQVDMKCHICWKDQSTVLVGWADTVRVCSIIERKPSQFAPDRSKYLLQPVFTFETGFIVCGVGPLDPRKVVVLGFLREQAEQTDTKDEMGIWTGAPLKPQLHVIEPATHDYCDLITDNLALRGYKKYTSSNYSLECLVSESRYIIVSPKDLVMAVRCDIDERIDWLLDRSNFEKAVKLLEQTTESNRHTVISVGLAHIDHLISTENFSKAAKLCHQTLGLSNKSLWEMQVYKFAQIQQLRSLTDYLPTEEDYLSTYVYDLVLYEYLKYDPQGFLNLVQKWPPRLYNVTAVGNAAFRNLSSAPNNFKSILIEALAILYLHDGKHELAVATFLKLKNKGIFLLIEKNKLYNCTLNILDDLLELDVDMTISTLTKSEELSPVDVVPRLSKNRKFLYLYLDALRKKDVKETEPFENLLVDLYAEFNRAKLMPFLQTSSHYNIENALTICKAKSYHPETAVILDRIGNTKGALNVYLFKMNNIESSVDFCIKKNDFDLWLDVMNYSRDKPDCVQYLLNTIGNYINPIILVERMDRYAEIPELKSALVKLLHDYNSQVAFVEGCKDILVSDYFNLQRKLLASRQKGFLVSEDVRCGSCHKNIFSTVDTDEAQFFSDIVAFRCSHVFHTRSECVPPDLECTICQTNKSEMK